MRDRGTRLLRTWAGPSSTTARRCGEGRSPSWARRPCRTSRRPGAAAGHAAAAGGAGAGRRGRLDAGAAARALDRHDVARRAPVAAGDADADRRLGRASPPRRPRLMPGLFSAEMWGGATFDVAYRFLKEDPWSGWICCAGRCRTCCCRCWCAARTRSATATTRTTWCGPSSQEAARSGIDVFRIFDSLNWVEAMTVAMEAAAAEGKLVRGGHLLHRRRRGSDRGRSTAWSTTCGWPGSWSAGARTSWASRTWPGC